MKIIFIFSLVVSLLEASVDSLVKAECQYIVYGNGTSLSTVSGYLSGAVAGQIYATDKENKTSAAYAAYADIRETACKEALSNNETKGFESKFQWGISIVIDKRLTQYSKL